MYCKKCGKELGKDDRFCSSCGTPVINEEVIYNSADSNDGEVKFSIDTSEFVWDVHDFTKPPRKVENVTVDWEKGTVTEIGEGAPDETEAEAQEAIPQEVIPTDAQGKASEEAETEKEAETVETEQFAGMEVPKVDETFAWTAPISLSEIEEAVQREGMWKEEPEKDVPLTLEDIQEDIEKAAEPLNPNLQRDTARLDRFYTLNKKNEEFQKLLDMEYERIKAGREGSYIVPGAVSMSEPKEEPKQPVYDEPETPETIEPEKEPEIAQPEQKDEVQEEKPVAKVSEVFDPVEHLKKAEEERNAALGIGTSLSRMAESYEAQKKNNVYYDDNGEEMRIFDTMELEKDLLEVASSTKSKNEIITEISDKIASTKEDVERTYSSLLDEIFGQISAAGAGAAAGAGIAAATTGSEKSVDDADAGIVRISEQPESHTKQEEPEKGPEMPENEADADSLGMDMPADSTEIPEATEVTEEKATGSTEQPEMSETSEEAQKITSFYDDDDDYEKKSPVGKIILAIVILILLAECVVLGIKYLMPDSKAAETIDSSLEKIALMIKGGDVDDNQDDNQDDGEEGQDADTDDPDNTPDVPDRSVPEADLSAVITGLASAKGNIASVTYDASVKYDENHKYNSTLVYETKALDSNILYRDEDATPHYVDEEAVKTLLAYNSGWIDYVNNGSNEIFNTLEEGSDAWNNTKGFNASGISKEFVSLNIGEIRAGAQDEYFVWAKEVIKTTKASKTTTDEYNWVYHMKLKDGKLLIVDYYK